MRGVRGVRGTRAVREVRGVRRVRGVRMERGERGVRGKDISLLKHCKAIIGIPTHLIVAVSYDYK